MGKQLVRNGLIAGVVLQLLVLMLEYLGAVYPLWTGQEASLKVIPVDPRSIFRGNYARLSYEISRIPDTALSIDTAVRFDQYVYVMLKPDAEGLLSFAGASVERPESGMYIRGRYLGDNQIKYGIEAYFAPREKAIALEGLLRRGGVAKVMIAANGKAALLEVMPLP
jgi:uncharacterized membrane-anchored protein